MKQWTSCQNPEQSPANCSNNVTYSRRPKIPTEISLKCWCPLDQVAWPCQHETWINKPQTEV